MHTYAAPLETHDMTDGLLLTAGTSPVADTGYAVGIQVLADLCLILGVLLVIGIIRYATGGRRLRSFLELGPSRAKTLRILVSSMFVKATVPSATIALNPIRVGFTGYALTGGEYAAALHLARSLRIPNVGRLLSTLANFIADRPLDPLGDTKIGGAPGYVSGPADHPDIASPEAAIRQILAEDSVVVAVGSPLYNSLSDHLTKNMGENTRVRFTRPADLGPDNIGYTLEVRPFGPTGDWGEFTRYRVADTQSAHYQSFVEYAVVQKISRRNVRRPAIFLCAGTSTASTVAAVSLLSDWRILAKEFPEGSFCIVLEVTVHDREQTEEFATSDIQLVQRKWQHHG